MRRLGAAAALVTMTVVASALAQAPAPNIDLAWSAPSGCPSSDAVLADVRAVLGGAPGTTHPVCARADVTRAEKRWHVDLAIQTDEGFGERSIEAESCTELARAVALIVALAIDPTRGPPTAPPSSSVDAGSPPAPPVPERAARRSVPAETPRLHVGAAGATDFGTMPSFGAGGTLALGGLYRRFRLEARARTLVSQRVVDRARPTQGVDLGYLGLDARACFAVLATGQPARDGVALSPCVGVDLDRLAGSGFGGQRTFSDRTVRAGFEGGLLGTWALTPRLALRGGADAILPAARPAFVVLASDGTTAGLLHRPAAVTGRVEIGAEVRFW